MALLAIHLQGCKCCAAALGVGIWAKRWHNKHSMEEQVWHLAFTTSTGVIVGLDMVSTPSKFTTAWWLASNLKTMPLAMKCQINNQKSRASPTQQTWIPLGLGISSNLIGVVLQSPSENILKRQLYVCEGLCWNSISNTAETIFC